MLNWKKVIRLATVLVVSACLLHCGGTSSTNSGAGSGSGDTTPPTVSITTPTNAQTVSGTVSLSAKASDNVGVSSVQLVVDDINLGAAITSAPYSYQWDTTKSTNGSHSLWATAKDAAGNVGTSAKVAVTVLNTQVSKPQIVSFTTNPPSITAGNNSTLQWSTSGATQITINPGNYQSTSANGSTSVSPTVTTQYQLTATNSAGSSSSSVTVTVGSTLACSGMSLGQNTSLNGFLPFPADNAWNTDITNAPVDPNSAALINYIGPTIGLHPDFGAGEYSGSYMGIPYVIVGGSQAMVSVTSAAPDQSDPGPMPIPVNAPIEGYPNPGNGDRHVLVLDNASCWLYETWSSYPNSDGSWNVGSAAVFDLLNDEQRPWTWTSADAAGLSVFAGLVRYDEAASGEIKHAIRFTLPNSRAAFTPPATHWAATSSDTMAAVMGMRLRLKASFDVSGFSATNQVILNALKHYGIIMADNGSAMYLTGAPNDNWNNDDLHNLGQVTAADFDVVLMNPIYTESNVPQGAVPSINSFTATPSSVAAGEPVTLNWNASNASYNAVSPDVGAIRGNQIVVSPTQSTTFTLYSTNAYGRSTATVSVTVQ